MKLKVKTTVESTKEIDVELPAFFEGYDSFDGGGGYNCVVRVNEDGKTAHYFSVDSTGEWQYHLTSNVDQFFTNNSFLYSPATEAVFFKMVDRLHIALNSIPKGNPL